MITVKIILHTNKEAHMKPSAMFPINTNSEATKHLSYHSLDYYIMCFMFTFHPVYEETNWFISVHSSGSRQTTSATGSLTILSPL